MSKILIILPTLGAGGAEKLHVNLANDWIKKGHKVEIVLMRKKDERTREILPLLSKKVLINCFDITRTPQIIIPLIKYLRKSLPDYTIAPMWPITTYSIIAWLLSGKIGKIYISDHIQLSHTAKYEINVSMFYLKTTIKITYPFANGIIVVSNGVREDLSKIGNIKKNNIKVIYNPVSSGKPFLRLNNEDRKKLWKGDYKYNILSVGSLKKQKDHKTLIKAFSLLPKELNAKLVIIGEGDLRNSLIKLIDELDLNSRVDLPGFVLDTASWYCSADLFVLSSLWEGFGNVLVESLETGLPVISTDCPSGPSEILKNGHYGTLVKPNNPKDLSDAIKNNLLIKHDKNKLIIRSKDFTIAKISKEYLDYMKLL